MINSERWSILSCPYLKYRTITRCFIHYTEKHAKREGVKIRFLFYKLAVSLYLMFMAVRGQLKYRKSYWLLWANTIFAMGLLRDYLTAGLFEPVRGLWQTEYTSFLLILIFMGMVNRHYHLLVAENSLSEPPSHVSLTDFLQAVEAETSLYAEAKGIYFQMELPKTAAFLRIQQSRLLRAMENIILNNTEYTSCQGAITVAGHISGCQAVISIKDTGCGIPARDLPHIFEYQFYGKSEEEKQGAVRGLGLYFARNAVMEADGTIHVKSEPGRGSEFTVTLPLA